MITISEDDERCFLHSPTIMPNASGFLWNKKMMIQVNCRGYAIAQYMQPEPSKYTYQPMVEGKIFMLPEQPFFANSPGRFFFIKDEETGEYFSAPYEPTKINPDKFEFSVSKSDVQWTVEHLGIEVKATLSIPTNDVVELWQVSVKNTSGRPRKISFYPYIPFGFMSWMNQSSSYREDLNAMVGKCVTPYQKLEDYYKNKNFKDLTFFIHERTPNAFEACRDTFEGEGGVQHPSGIQHEQLANGDALYETPCAVFQYRLNLAQDQLEDYRFLLGPAFDDEEIKSVRNKYFFDKGFKQTHKEYASYIAQGKGVLTIETPDKHFDNFVNQWLARQVFYHGDVNRLTTDPQTRNYLQDSMGMAYVKPEATKKAFLWALAQQEESGAMPDGILLREDAELKYINQIPHTDHSVWLPVCLSAYLNETNDYDFLNTPVPHWKTTVDVKTVAERISNAMRWLLKDRDARGLNYIAQGDWNDPMNMVGHKGKGVSGWLSIATVYALRTWADICEYKKDSVVATEFRDGANAMQADINKHLWDGDWYGRGITDDGVLFGSKVDKEGRIFLNPQSWALMAGITDKEQKEKILSAIDDQLDTPFGVMMLAPAYTAMRNDVGRLTQKHPGAAENGSIYNHAAAFYAWGLCYAGEADRAFHVIRKMIAGPTDADYAQRGQMPIYIPNYYRGAYYQFPRTAGRSSQLFNTGTVSWVYRSLVEGIFGLKGCTEGLKISPLLPTFWNTARVRREFRGALFDVKYERVAGVKAIEVWVDGELLNDSVYRDITTGVTYSVVVRLPD